MLRRQITRGPSEGSKPSKLPPRASDFDVIEGGSTWKVGAYDRPATLPNSVVDTFHKLNTEERSWRSFLKVVCGWYAEPISLAPIQH